MKKEIEEFRKRALPNLKKITGGGNDGPIDRDKVRRPKNGLKN